MDKMCDKCNKQPAQLCLKCAEKKLNIKELDSWKRGMAEYYMQHNYRDMYSLWTDVILPILEDCY